MTIEQSAFNQGLASINSHPAYQDPNVIGTLSSSLTIGQIDQLCKSIDNLTKELKKHRKEKNNDQR